MAKQLNIDMRFNADVSAAKAQLQSLQTSLNQLTTGMAAQGTQLGITPKLQEAQQAAVQLKTALNQSMNVETGKFDLSKFNSSLKLMNTDLSKLKTQLTNLGPQGQQTFMALAQSIMTAEIPTKRISASLAALGTTLKNTAKWQLSSSMLHGFMSAVQTSYRYAQDLNQSLNSIRIVTGESAEAMDKFAARANKAAKALSASTLDYTDAALIFYQQGLRGKDVDERAEITLKMANVSRQSAEIVSDQLTAVWNNFANGTDSLESFADKMVALGAATASSSDEIAGGLEKFAAIGETIGLSFDYAAAALATITSNTRQSEEVVGTALKTIFARMQGLKLGETLEDGVELNKYSQALETIGVSIFDGNKQLKDMDTILEETAAKWNTLTKAQQTATAQTVAGIRQYNQFIALMDNWDDGTGDSMVANLETAANATGALQEQADTYAESWEGANKRIKASAEAIYTDLLDDDFFIGLTNGFADFLDLIDKLLDSMGGAKGLLTGLSSILLNMFAGSAAKGLENMVYNFKSFVGLAQKEAVALQNTTYSLASNMGPIGGVQATSISIAQTTGMEQQLTLNHALLGIKEKITEEDQLMAQAIIEQNQAYSQQLITLGQAKDQALNTQQSEKSNLIGSILNTTPYSAATANEMVGSINKDLDLSSHLIVELEKIDSAFEDGKMDIEEYIAKIKKLEQQASSGKLEQTAKYLHSRTSAQGSDKRLNDNTIRARAKDKNATDIMNVHGRQDAENNVVGDNGRFKNLTERAAIDTKAIEKYAQATQEANRSSKKFADGQTIMAKATQEAKEKILALGNTTMKWSQVMVGVAQSAMSLSFALNSLKSIYTTWQDDTIGVGDKILQTFMSAGMAIPMLMNGFTGLSKAAQGYIGLMSIMQTKQATMNSIQMASTTLYGQEVKLLGSKITALTAEQLAEKTGMTIDQAKITLGQARMQQMILNKAATEGEMSATLRKVAADKLGITVEQMDIVFKKLQEGATWRAALAEVGATGIKKLFTKETWKQIAANAVLIGQFIAMLWPLWAIIGAIGLLVGGLKLANSIYNKEANAAKEAGEAAARAAEQFEEAQNKYNEFKETISNYDDAVAGLAKLTKGTVEYKEQIMKANEEAMKLINSQGLLYGKDYKYSEDGLIEFTDGTLEKAKEQEFNSLERQQANRDFTAQRAKTAQSKADLVEFSRNNLNDDANWNSEDWGDLAKVGSWGASGAAIGATIGTIVPIIGTGIGAAVGGALGLIAGSIDALTDDVKGDSSENELQSMYKLAEAYDKKGDEALTPENIKEVLGENNTILDDVFAKPTAEMAKALIEEKDPKADFDMEELNDLFAEKGEDITPEDLKAYFDQNGITMDQASIDQMFQSVIDPEVKSQIASLAANTAAIRAHVERTAGAANQDNEAYQRLSEEDQSIADKIIANRVDDALVDKDSDAYADLEKKALEMWQAETKKATGEQEAGFFKGNEDLTYDKYMEITYGKDWKDNYKVENKGGTSATIYQKNEEGDWENIDPDDKKNTVSNDEIKEALVEHYAKQYSDEDAKKLVEVNSAAAEVRANVGGIGTIADQDIKSAFASGETADLTFMTEEQKDELKAELENGTIKVTDEYKQLLLDGANAWSQAAHDARMEAEADSVIAEGASKYGLDEKVLKAQAEMLQQAHEGLENNAVAAAEMAVANQRLNKGVKTLSGSWKDWNKSLRATDKTTQDYAEAVVGVQDAMRDMFGLTEDAVIPEDFLQDTENLDLLDQIANGSEEAAQKLHFNLTKAQIEAETFSSDIKQNMINAFDFGKDTDFEATFNEMKTQALNALSEIQGMANGVDIGAGLKDPAKQAEMAAKLNEYAMAAGWTAEQMQSALASVGVRAKITMVEGNPVAKKIPITRVSRKRIKNDIFTGEQEWLESSQVEGYKDVTEPTLVPQIDMEDPENPSGQTAPIFEKVDMGNIAPSATQTSGGGGGGGSKPTKTSEAKKDKTDIVDRYKEVNDQLAKTERLMDKNSALADTLWGSDKIKKIQENTKALEEENKQLEEKIKLQKQYLQEDKGELVKAASDVGLNFEFGEDGTILNYTTEMTKLHNQREAMLAGFGDEMDETEQETLEKFDEKIEAVTSAYETYEETLNEGFEFDQEKLENEIEQMENRFQEIELKLEVEIELNENDIADIEHQLERLGDSNVYASAERIALIEKNAASYRNIADAQIESIREAERLYQEFLNTDGKSGISKEDYMARLQEGKEALQDAEMSIRDGIQQIGEELSNTFDLVDEKLDQQFTKFDQMIELMDHYKNVVSLTQGEASYKEFNKILRASQEVLRDRIAADESEVTMWTARREQLEADIATLPEDSPAKREAEEALQAIMEKEADAKSQLMADIEQLGEYAREIFENSIEQAMKDFEDEMFGRPLNSIIESIEMMNSRQEELLTTTNKIYETNKLIRSVEKDIEATTNNKAKQAFAEFQNKVKQKQEQNELTKFELDLLTAEYEMTKAQIALEEAQNAKDTVRLTRDAEGNYGYVYTANEDKVADAEQALDDATNNYYNTALEGAQKYQDQIYQHIQEWEEKVKEVYLDQTLSEEEKNKKIKEITDTYNTLITQDKELYYMAIGAMQESAYNTQVDYDLKGIESAENWFTECDGFLSDLEDAQDEYDRNTKEVSDHTEENFGRMETSIKKTKIESEKLKNQIVNDLVPELDTTLKNSIDNATEAWWKYIEALQEVIRLTDEAMKKNHDTQLKEGYKDNYAAEIQERLANGADYSDYDIQRLLEYRWEKMGGVDNTDYAALIAAGGTSEQIALWEVLRKWKIEQTDWSASDADYADEMRENKLDQDYAQLIIDYLTSSPYGRWSDSQIQKYLKERQTKIDERGLTDVMSNIELKKYIAEQMGKKPEELFTGGYTGSWGPEGKLAVLHEKELVLNAEDTKNFLSATGILREISQMLDRDALIASLGAINLQAMTLNSPADQVLQQEVTIHADFPNVTDHNEIEIAIDNLINAASQHAYRT